MSKDTDERIVHVPGDQQVEAFYAIRFGSGQLYTGGPNMGRFDSQAEAEDEALRKVGSGPTSMGIVLVNIYPVGTVERQVHKVAIRKRYSGDTPANEIGVNEEVDAVDDVRIRVEPDEDALYETAKEPDA